MNRLIVACLIATAIIFAAVVVDADAGAPRDGGTMVARDGGAIADPSMSTGPLPATRVSVLAGSGTDPEISDAVYFVRLIVSAAKHKQWRLLCGLGLVALTWALRRFGAKKIPWLATDRGGVALILGTSMLTAIASLALSKMAVNIDSLTDALTNGVIAAGGYAMLKKLWAPAEKKKEVIVAAGAA